jgi:hypothetical protein
MDILDSFNVSSKTGRGLAGGRLNGRSRNRSLWIVSIIVSRRAFVGGADQKRCRNNFFPQHVDLQTSNNLSLMNAGGVGRRSNSSIVLSDIAQGPNARFQKGRAAA